MIKLNKIRNLKWTIKVSGAKINPKITFIGFDFGMINYYFNVKRIITKKDKTVQYSQNG